MLRKTILSGNILKNFTYGNGFAFSNSVTSLQIIRHLYNSNGMGIDNFLAAREKVKTNLLNNTDKFKTKMEEFLQENSTNMIFTEDLKNMIHIAEKKPDDIELVVKMLKKFNAQNKELRFGNFVFGPVVMRMLYNLKDEDTALKCFKDPDLGNFFDQLISYQLLLDMLYEKNRYSDVINVVSIIKERQVEGGKYPRHVIVLAFAACYKQNTAESFKVSSDLWKELQDVGHIPMRKGAAFAAALALQQNSPHIALEIISTVRKQNYMTVRNIKAIALAELGRPDDALPILRSVLEIDDPTQMKHTFVKDTVIKVKNAILKSENKEFERDFERIEKFLTDNGHVTEMTLDDLLCTEIIGNTFNNQTLRKDRSVLAASFSGDRSNYKYSDRNSDRNFQRNKNRSRPGLQDLY